MYRLPQCGPGVIRAADSVRLVEGANGWSEYEAWRAAGNSPSAASPLPPSPHVVTYDHWLALFTQQELDWAFGSNDPGVRMNIALGSSLKVINLDDPRTAAFLDLCISLGSPLTNARRQRIISGLPPLD